MRRRECSPSWCWIEKGGRLGQREKEVLVGLLFVMVRVRLAFCLSLCSVYIVVVFEGGGGEWTRWM